MASGKPIVRQVAWLSLMPQMLVLAVLIAVFTALEIEEPVIISVFVYLIYSIGSRYLISISHRKGISAFKQGDYTSALQNFEESYKFFQKYRWIDKWRFLILLSSSKISYREMALLNIAFCYSQLGEGVKSKQSYEKVLIHFPDSQMAVAALNMIDAVAKNTEQGNAADI